MKRASKSVVQQHSYDPRSTPDRAPMRPPRRTTSGWQLAVSMPVVTERRETDTPETIGADESGRAPSNVVTTFSTVDGVTGGEAVLRALELLVNPIAAFCVWWPSSFIYMTDHPLSNAITSEEVFAVPREQLAGAFAIALFDGSASRGSVVLAPWRVERLPLSLQRPPFLVPGVTKITLPFRVDGELVGFAGLALPCKLGEAEHAWYAGCCAALTQSLAPSGGALGAVAVAARASALERELVHDVEVDHVLLGEDDVTREPPLVGWELGESARHLSTREREIATYLAEGHSTINVGANLGLSANTVRTYVRRIYAKLNVCSRVELARRIRG